MKNLGRLVLIGAVAFIALICAFVLRQPSWAQGIVTVAGGVMALVMFGGMVKTLRSGSFGVDLLAITAVVATLVVGEYWAALIVLVMLTGGDALEDHAAKVASRDLKQLLDNAPVIAHRQTATGLSDVAVDAVAIGETLVVKPGEMVPVDGVVLQGESLVDEASLTGEAKPVTKTPGATLMSGTINGDVALVMTVTHTAATSQYQGIVKLVKESEAKPAHFVRLADRYAVPFTIIAYVLAGLAWVLSGDATRVAEVLVVASPCPLILAAPVAMVSGMSRASRSGIIVKSGTTLEKLAAAKTVAFDKTGTLTQGVLAVAQIVPVGEWQATDLLQLAASAEQQSTHILARSLVEAETSLKPATQVREVTGRGVQAEVAGHQVHVGRAAFVHASQTVTATAVHVSIDGVYAGYITFSDRVRPEAHTTVTRLHELGVVETLMISGDASAVADAVAETVGIDVVHAQQLPEQKIAVLAAVPKARRPVVMVGDGVNDAPSLATADVGIAMGAHGNTAASDAADAVVLPDDLSKVADAVVIAKGTMRVAKTAVGIGIAICTVLMVIASFGVIPAVFGALLQEVVDTVTIVAALQARRG